MKSSENIILVYIFPENVWLPVSDVFVLAIYWSFSHRQNTIQICQKCKDEKCYSISGQSWCGTMHFILLMQLVGDFYLNSPPAFKIPL